MSQGFVQVMLKEVRLNDYIVESLILPDNQSDDVDVSEEEVNEEDQYNL